MAAQEGLAPSQMVPLMMARALMMVWATASDARMSGCEMPVVILSGSGNQGMTASLPVIRYAKHLGVDKDKLYRALLVSDLVTVHQKSGIGRLSAYCGAVSAVALLQSICRSSRGVTRLRSTVLANSRMSLTFRTLLSVRLSSAESETGFSSRTSPSCSSRTMLLWLNIIKNVKSVVVPNTGGRKGIQAAIAAGVVSGKAEKILQVISGVPASDHPAIAAYAQNTPIEVICAQTTRLLDIQLTGYAGGHSAAGGGVGPGLQADVLGVVVEEGGADVGPPVPPLEVICAQTTRLLDIQLTGYAGGHSALVHIANSHSNIVREAHDGEVLLEKPASLYIW